MLGNTVEVQSENFTFLDMLHHALVPDAVNPIVLFKDGPFLVVDPALECLLVNLIVLESE